MSHHCLTRILYAKIIIMKEYITIGESQKILHNDRFINQRKIGQLVPHTEQKHILESFKDGTSLFLYAHSKFLKKISVIFRCQICYTATI